MTPTVMPNIFAEIPAELPRELETRLAEGGAFRLKRIVSRGHSTGWYDQPELEWVILLSGAAELEFNDGKKVPMQPGDWRLIPAHCRHRVSWTDPDSPSVWLALLFEP